MRALSNLINLNQPDLVLFVGEALVGNDAGAQGAALPLCILPLLPLAGCLWGRPLVGSDAGAWHGCSCCCLSGICGCSRSCGGLTPPGCSGPADQVEVAIQPLCCTCLTLPPPLHLHPCRTPAVDQLTKFNQRLADLCPDPNQRHLIDGIVLTKFDTIDDKVGTCSS